MDTIQYFKREYLDLDAGLGTTGTAEKVCFGKNKNACSETVQKRLKN
jgi:hypothetical protein